jgi:hypothetical protein
MAPFDLVTRVLAERLGGSTTSVELRAALADESVSWERVVGLASEQFVLSAFAAALRDLDLLAGLDPELRQFLRAIHLANGQRNARLRTQLAEVLSALNQAGIEPVLLKGAIRLTDQLYPDLGWRMLQDLDILVPPSRLAEAVGALYGIGYTIAAGSPDLPADHRHYPGLVHPAGCAPVELHTDLFPPTKRRPMLLNAAEMRGRTQPARLDNSRARLPSLEHQMIHLIGHCQIAHHGHVRGEIELRDRLEAAALVRWSPASVDWQAVLASFAAAGFRRALLTFLLSLQDGELCTVAPVPAPDWLTTLEAWRIMLQARSTAAAQLGRDAAMVREEILERGAGLRTILAMLIRRIAGAKASNKAQTGEAAGADSIR